MTAVSNSQSAKSKRSHLQPATYSLADVAGLLGLSYSTVHLMVVEGRAPVEPLRIGRAYRFRKADVRKLLGLEDVPENEVTR